MASTLVSEDAALAGAALLARSGTLPAPAAAAAVALGIWVGDVGLFMAGRLARRWPPVSRWVDRRWPASRLAAMGVRLNRGAAAAILLSRVTPGSRLPLYVAAGVLSMRPSLFAAWTALGSIGWSATIVLGISWLS